MNSRIITTLFAAMLAYGQGKPTDSKLVEVNSESWEATTIQIKTLTSEESFNRLLRLLNIFNSNAKYAGDSQLRIISVYGPKEVVTQIRHVVQDLDKPGSKAAIGRNIDMTMTFLRCSSKAVAASTVLPADMEPVARQLRAASLCKDVQVWDYLPLHLQEGKEATENMRLPGTLPKLPGATSTVEIRMRPDSVTTKASGRFVRFGIIRVEFKIPIPTGSFETGSIASPQFTNTLVGVNTAGDFLEGQKTVLGKMSGMDDESSIFVVIALKVLD